MSATYDLTTDVGKVRLLISDKDIANAVFSDEELEVFLTSEGSVKLGAAAALEAWAASYAANPDNEHIGDYSYGQSVSAKMLDLAAKLRAGAAVPAIGWAEMDLLDTAETEVT